LKIIGLEFNAEKYKIISFSRSGDKINGVGIDRIEKIYDL
jgi:hypothetical protein